jgi:hypothetical protein
MNYANTLASTPVVRLGDKDGNEVERDPCPPILSWVLAIAIAGDWGWGCSLHPAKGPSWEEGVVQGQHEEPDVPLTVDLRLQHQDHLGPEDMLFRKVPR